MPRQMIGSLTYRCLRRIERYLARAYRYARIIDSGDVFNIFAEKDTCLSLILWFKFNCYMYYWINIRVNYKLFFSDNVRFQLLIRVNIDFSKNIFLVLWIHPRKVYQYSCRFQIGGEEIIYLDKKLTIR